MRNKIAVASIALSVFWVSGGISRAQSASPGQSPIPLATGTALSASSLGILNATPTPAPMAAATPMAVMLLASECNPSGACDTPSPLPRIGSATLLPPLVPGTAQLPTGTMVLPPVSLGDSVVLSIGGIEPPADGGAPPYPLTSALPSPLIVTINSVRYSVTGPITIKADAPGISSALITTPGVIGNRMTVLVHY